MVTEVMKGARMTEQIKKCKDCEHFRIEKPDAMNEGHAYCSKYNVSTMLVGKSAWKKKVDRLECWNKEGETDKIKSAIEKLKGFYMNGSCHEDFNDCICYECKEHCEDGEPIILAIRSLQAWSEVLNELKNMREIIWQDTDDEQRIVRANAWDKIEILNKAIDIINQHLAEIEEEQNDNNK